MIVVKLEFKDKQTNALFSALMSKGGAASALNAGFAANARNEWLKLAGERLQTSRRDYIAGIQALEQDGVRMLIALVGGFPNMIEQGTDGFDLRDTLLRKFGLHHRVIPFRHRTPGSAGTTGVGTPMGHAYGAKFGETAGKELGKKVYRQASKLTAGQALPAGLAPRLKDQSREQGGHETDLYAGMQRMRTGAGKGQVRYMTFRTISEDSPAQAWLYPAIAPRNLMEQVVERLPDIAEKLLRGMLTGIGSGTP